MANVWKCVCVCEWEMLELSFSDLSWIFSVIIAVVYTAKKKTSCPVKYLKNVVYWTSFVISSSKNIAGPTQAFTNRDKSCVVYLLNFHLRLGNHWIDKCTLLFMSRLQMPIF